MRLNLQQELMIGLITIAGILVLLFGYAWRYRQQTAPLRTETPSTANTGSTATSPSTATDTAGTAQTYTAQDLQTHNLRTDCWLVIHQNVYDVTTYIDQHPGGARRIIPYCGADATTAFDTKGGEGWHSALAKQILARYQIGTFAGSV